MRSMAAAIRPRCTTPSPERIAAQRLSKYKTGQPLAGLFCIQGTPVSSTEQQLQRFIDALTARGGSEGNQSLRDELA